MQIGGDNIYGQRFAGLIDDVRIYNNALTAAQIQTDMNTPVSATQAPPDTTPPSAPASLTATPASTSQINLSWPAATDNVAVAGYRVERQDPGSTIFTQFATPTSTTFNNTGLAAGATYSYRVRAVDAAGNLGAYSPVATATTQADTTAPTVSVTAPTGGATVTGTITISATASDNVGVVGVQFLLDGTTPIGSEDTSSPYSVSWNTSTVATGQHTLSARARDAAGNSTTSSSITVNVTNANNPAVVGQWSSVMNFPLVAINMVLMKDSRILMWSGQDCIGGESATVWDPATNTFTPVPLAELDGSDRDIFCSGMTVLADGRVLDAGGHECKDLTYLGTAIATLFDPTTNQWTIAPDMQYRRWYPTIITMGDGRAIVIGGGARDYTPSSYSKIPEVFDPQTNTWTTLSNAVQTIPNYAFVFQLPDGRILAAGSDEALMATYALNVATQTWAVVDSRVLDAGSAVMYLPGKIMKAGSSYIAGDQTVEKGIPSKATTYVLDMTQSSPAWQQTASMANPRTHLNLTVLPDGNVLATGGSSDISGEFPQYGVLPAEMWSPTTQTWTTMASMAVPRMYHSTALLLPDGRILSAGGGRTGDSVSYDYLNAEIYSPAYLFKGARPTITAAPTTVNYNSNFFIQTPDGASIASVSLIRNGSVTHAVNMDQRFVPLSFTQTGGGLNVQAPANANLAPPGTYMLFIVNSNGVPSIAPFVRLPAGYEDSQAPTAPGNLNANGGIGSAALTWNAATDNTGVVRYNVYRSTTTGFAPTIANRIAQPTTTYYTNTGLSAGTYYYLVTAEDAVGNIGPPTGEASATVTTDSVLPSVAITSPVSAATVTGLVTVNVSASDDVGVASVQFLVDGNAVGAADTSAPYSFSWNSATLPNGTHVLTARATDTGGNTKLSDPVSVTVSNALPSGLVLALGFNEGAGTTAADISGNSNNGTLSGATWSTSGKFGNALSFNGTNNQVIIPDRPSLDLTTGMTLEAWVRPSSVASAWRDIIYKVDDIYYLEGSSFQSGGVPAMGGTIQRQSPVRLDGACGKYVDTPGGHVRRRDDAVVRQRHPGGQ